MGVKTAMPESTPGSLSTATSAPCIVSGRAPVNNATGLLTAAPAGSSGRRRSRTWLDSSGTTRPAVSQASAASTPGPPLLPTMATFRPAGSGARSSRVTTSNSSASESARITPACANSASTATSGVAAAAVCEATPRPPATDRPDFTATTGFVRPTRRASRANLHGLPNDSR